MIQRFRSRALQEAFAGQVRRLQPNVAARIRAVLSALDAAEQLSDLQGLTGFHALHGDRAGEYAVTITRNWRVTFTPTTQSVTNPLTLGTEKVFAVTRVDYEDYH